MSKGIVRGRIPAMEETIRSMKEAAPFQRRLCSKEWRLMQESLQRRDELTMAMLYSIMIPGTEWD